LANLLVTGFEPFDGFSVNPSEELVKNLQNRKIGAYNVEGLVLPLDYKSALGKLEQALEEFKPDVVLCFGQAYRAAITLERIAINAQSTTREDNYGNKPESDIILESAPAAYFSTIDPHPLIAKLLEKGIPASPSYHAGTYGCNWILYRLLHKITATGSDTKAIFIHLPPLPEQAIEKNRVNLATIPLPIQVQAAEIIITQL
jgi:pyroglutamyl-peptidase